jgi:methylenetetrahydrofolate dehydrogenase (NADP+) / methenyltetrahydrofolate cyclohydrolase
MATILEGKQVTANLKEKMIADVTALKEKNVIPTLAIMRVGEEGDAIAYEKGAMTRCKTVGVEVKNCVLPADATQDDAIALVKQLNEDKTIHGVLMLRPLPKQMNDEIVRAALDPAKDIDGITDISMVGTYTSTKVGFEPCTPAACMEILEFFNIDCTGKNAVVVGRSLVVGKPAAMMLLKRNATVTVCHTKTKNLGEICRKADIIIACAGKAGSVGADCFAPGQIVIDVGINFDAAGNMCGDADFAAAEPIVAGITPVPGGVGTVTTSVLVKHVVEAAKRQSK